LTNTTHVTAAGHHKLHQKRNEVTNLVPRLIENLVAIEFVFIEWNFGGNLLLSVEDRTRLEARADFF
jgi:hypothetical protein